VKDSSVWFRQYHQLHHVHYNKGCHNGFAFCAVPFVRIKSIASFCRAILAYSIYDDKAVLRLNVSDIPF
jgi:tRNA A37 methylthiotransferase MiaB